MDLVNSQSLLAAIAGSSATAVGAAVLWHLEERNRAARSAARRASRRARRILQTAIAEAEQLLREVELTPAGHRAVARPAVAGQRLPSCGESVNRNVAQGRATVLVPEPAGPPEPPLAAAAAAAVVDPPGWAGWGYLDPAFDHLHQPTVSLPRPGGRPE